MEERILLRTFTYPHHMGIVRALLESEGIPCFLEDEQMVNVHPFASTALGGIKLKVAADDHSRAREILIEHGHLEEEEEKAFSLIESFDDFTRNWPLLGKLFAPLRLLILSGALLSLIFCVLFYWLNRPSDLDRIKNSMWCILEMEYDHEWFDTTNSVLDHRGCVSSIRFLPKQVEIPIKDGLVRAKWQINGSTLFLEEADRDSERMNGSWEFTLDKENLILEKGNLFYRCFRIRP